MFKKLIQVIFCVIGLMLTISCQDKSPLKIGYVGTLSGPNGKKGNMIQNGIVLAMEEINKNGGINNRYIELIVRDDKGKEEVAKGVVEELIGENVIAIIGHTSSSMSKVGSQIATQNKTVMISPTTSTDSLSNIDDYFFRISTPSAVLATQYADYAYNTLNLRNMNSIYDLSNFFFSVGWFEGVSREYKKLGGRINYIRSFSSGDEIDLEKTAQQLLKNSPDGLFIAANPVETGKICQSIRRLNKDVKIIASIWSMGEGLISIGGVDVEGVSSFSLRNKKHVTPKIDEFNKNFETFFGNLPVSDADLGYEVAKVLFSAISNAKSISKIKDELIDRKYEGLHKDIYLNNYGDPNREYYLITVKDGELVSP